MDHVDLVISFVAHLQHRYDSHGPDGRVGVCEVFGNNDIYGMDDYDNLYYTIIRYNKRNGNTKWYYIVLLEYLITITGSVFYNNGNDMTTSTGSDHRFQKHYMLQRIYK